LEGTNADEDKSPAADVEEVDEGVPLLDEQDEQLDATEKRRTLEVVVQGS
jgi:hypothetical protein